MWEILVCSALFQKTRISYSRCIFRTLPFRKNRWKRFLSEPRNASFPNLYTDDREDFAVGRYIFLFLPHISALLDWTSSWRNKAYWIVYKILYENVGNQLYQTQTVAIERLRWNATEISLKHQVIQLIWEAYFICSFIKILTFHIQHNLWKGSIWNHNV